MFFHQRTVPGLAIFSYMVGDENTGRCAVIDPVRDIKEYIQIAEKQQLTITDIFETHVHADFVSGALELKTALSGEPTIHCSAMGGDEWTPTYCDDPIQDGDEISLGSIRLRAIHTPGHTPEHIMWELFDSTRSNEIPWLIFTGDFLFVGAVGRPDLLGTEAMKELSQDLYHTLFETIRSLPDYVEIYPAHGSGSLCGKAIGARDSSTIGYERKFNPFMQQLEQEAWISKLMNGMPKYPPYFPRMKQINVKGPTILGNKFDDLNSLSITESIKLIEEEKAVLLDARNQHDLALLHIDKSINIPYGNNMSTWAGWFIDDNRPIILTTDDKSQYPDICKQLIRIGLDNISGYLEGGVSSWEDANSPTTQFKTWSVEKLNNLLTEDNPPILIDVRTMGEWESGHIPGALHIPMDTLTEKISSVNKGEKLALICRTGYRASVAASIAQRLGYKNVVNIDGGMVSWHQKKLPLEI
ncbi:MAG: MBL fold metallo-hydrolase [Chlamydiota bacterium]